MKSIIQLLMEEETQYWNALAVHIIFQGSNSTDVLDVNKHKAFTVQELADDLDKVQNLKNKPKILMVQKCRGEKDEVEHTSVVLFCVFCWCCCIPNDSFVLLIAETVESEPLTGNAIPALPENKDFFIGYNCITQYR